MSDARERWRGAARILCVRLDAVGDVLMTSPAIHALKRARPGRHVTLCTSSPGARAAPLLPDVDDVVVYDSPWMKATPAGQDAAPHRAAVERLASARFDAAVVFTVYTQSPLPAALLCHEAGIPLRLAHCRENPYQLLTDWIREPEPERFVRHEVRRQLDLVASVGAPVRRERLALRVPAGDRRAIGRRLAALGLADRAWIAMHPGATAPSRRYPAEAFVDVGRALAARGHRLVLVGAPDEAPLVQEIAAAIGDAAVSLAGTTTLAELAALLARAAVVVANNSGPMHVAAAVGTPVVALYALTNPQHLPWGVAFRVLNRDVPCRYCQRSVCPEGHHACLRGVPPGDVVDATLALLAAAPRCAPHADDGGDSPAVEASG